MKNIGRAIYLKISLVVHGQKLILNLAIPLSPLSCTTIILMMGSKVTAYRSEVYKTAKNI